MNKINIYKYSFLINLFFLSLINSQSYIPSDPIRLKFVERNQFYSQTSNIQAMFVRPFFNYKTSKNALKSIGWRKCAVCSIILQNVFLRRLYILEHPPIIFY